MSKKAKIFIIIVVFLTILTGGLYFLGRQTNENRNVVWGVTFDEGFVKDLGLDWQKTYLAILDNLKVKKLRLVAHWSDLEAEEGKFNFSELDWQVTEAQKRGAEVILAVGRKTPRWPECNDPAWFGEKSPEQQKEKLLAYLAETVNHYKTESAITAWQVENEPFLSFGVCPSYSNDYLDEEITLIKSLDQRPILVTDSGELSFWIRAAKRGDFFGTTMYRQVNNKIFGQIEYPLPPAFFRAKERLTRLFVGQDKKFIVIELQGEPWNSAPATEAEKQLQLFSPDYFKGISVYAEQTGFNEYYWWGVEWWYYMKEKGHPEYWNFVKELIN